MDNDSKVSTNKKIIAPALTEMTSSKIQSTVIVPTDLSKKSPKASVKEKVNNITITKEKLNDAKLLCEWNLCCVFLLKIEMKKFLMHIAGHISTANDSPTNEGFLCLWRNCGYACQTISERNRHIYFHAFHAKIKGVGEVVMKLFNMQCSIDDQTRSIIPEIPDPFECLWANCGSTFVSAQEFYWHVESHPNSVYHEKSKWEIMKANKKFICSWKGCKTVTKVSYRLVDHVRSHSQEKIVACPNCGSIYASFPKFRDHCFRHVSEENLKFECSHCKCKFATERLLKEHIRSHVNHFKCPHCDMTCPTKFSLENHIIYRHTNNKPFKCSQCDKRFKLQQDVIRHLISHATEASFACPYPDCHFSSRSASTYHLHMKKNHTDINAPDNPYMCHICERKFSKGTKLTSHLKKEHDFHWPSGHVRFRYSKDVDGFYKLQTTRIESIDLSQDILSEDAVNNPDDPDDEEDEVEQELLITNSTDKNPEKLISEKETGTMKLIDKNEKFHYMCHVCQKIFSKGPKLKNHLEKFHDYHWPSTCTTFRYRKGADDFYKLTIVRFESFKLIQDSLNDSFCVTGLLSEDVDNKDNVNSKEALYRCQICQWKFVNGEELIKHFEINHNFKWPPTYFKFRFQDVDGCRMLHALQFEFESSSQLLNNNHKSTSDASITNEALSALRLSTMKENIRKNARTLKNIFMCHICKKKYGNSHKLMHHLKKSHNFGTSYGDIKFSKDSDGFYKLKDSQAESLNATNDSATWLPMTPDVVSILGMPSSALDHKEQRKTLDNLYNCHICLKKFDNGARLIEHLESFHKNINFKGPNKFRKDEQGYWELKSNYVRNSEFTQSEHDNCNESDIEDLAEQLPMTPDVTFSVPGLITVGTNIQEQLDVEISKRLFKCHLCTHKFDDGTRLTDHLRNFHSLRWTDHNVYKFNKDKEGHFKIQFEADVAGCRNILVNEDNIGELEYEMQLPKTPEATYTVAGLVTDEATMLADELMLSQPFKKQKKQENQVLRFVDL